MARLKPLDLAQIQIGSVRRRTYRLNIDQLARAPQPTAPLHEFLRGLPRVGEAAGLLQAAELLAQAALDHRPILWVIDGRMIELGLSTLLVHLMQRDLVHGLLMNDG